ncbi:lysylphosphatidylglycerol synthase transmembrane domain-containing protein [Pseudomonas typographi]|uniref:Flippase-like domain-containing protein n=1 Tax=Pseudomonas typographi TaxID=2715964 RepID=A0ABR7YX95_9PSED|nr:lysylphosphatidylglycerol synthase transmembrane domain-containing protein [Pseudomonas typographi]MBD1550922.1 flippase-like domain-containing protein [Pseudomonas typographi]MBD1585747.1 flippase-like domain-containing protein [Pseudomonas typographi]MBD1597821.1 flippase-like domain-containing protein [Pseudomonas typographi]
MKRLLWLGLAIVAALAIPLVLGGGEMFGRLRGFPLSWLLGMFAMILLCWVINSTRTRLLLGDQAGNVGPLRCLGLVMATEFAYCATPGGSGAPLTFMALLRRHGVHPARSGAVFAMDQLNDLLFFLFALIGVLCYALLHHLNEHMRGLLVSSAVLIVAALAGCYGLARYHRRLLSLSGKLLARLRVRHATRWRWARRTLHFSAQLAETLRQPKRRLLLVFGLTCVHWSLRYTVLYITLLGLGAELEWAWSFLVQMLALCAGQFSLLPGGAGATELTSAALLAPMVGKSTAAAAILIWRIVTYYFYLVAGGPLFLMLVGKPLLARLLRLGNR